MLLIFGKIVEKLLRVICIYVYMKYIYVYM